MKKERVRIEIDLETGDFDIDVVNTIGSSCAKDAEEWAKIGGGAKKVTRKPEYFQKSPKKQENTQTL